MTDTPRQLIVAAYHDPDEAGQRLEDLRLGRRAGLIGIIDAAAVSKDVAGKLKVTDARHRGRRGLLTGGAIGAVAGLLAGPVGWGALGGGALGGLVGRVRNAPIKAELLELGESMPAESSALIALVEHTWVTELEHALAEQSMALVRDEIRADLLQQLEDGGNVVYTLGADEEGVGGARLASDSDGAARLTGFLATDDGILIEEAELTTEALPDTGSAEQT